jgi:hypothetical protein
MQWLSVWVRRIATTILIPIFTAVAARFIWEQPQTANALLKPLLDLAEQTWLRVTALLLIGFVAGLWLDWLLRRLDLTRNAAREKIGIEMQDLATKLENAAPPATGLPPYYAELISLLLKVGKHGIWVPLQNIQSPEYRLVMCAYLKVVGTLLSDGHFDVARSMAWTLKDAFKRPSAEQK